MVKKRSVDETVEVEEAAVVEDVSIPETSNDEESQNYAKLFSALQEIRQDKNVIGYILRNEEKATIDLEDPARIIEYAMLSSQVFESSNEISSTFNLDGVENALVEGKNIKLLCIKLGENKLSIFMEKTADHKSILEAFSNLS